MRRHRGLVLLALLFTVTVLGLAFSSTVQTWAANRLLVVQEDRGGSVGQVSIGWGTVEIRDLRFEQKGLVLFVPEITVETPWWKLVSGGVHLERLVAKGWTVTLDSPQLMRTSQIEATVSLIAPSEAGWGSLLMLGVSGAEELNGEGLTSQGLLSWMNLPTDVSVEVVELQGQVVWSAYDMIHAGHVSVEVNGGGVQVGLVGHFDIGVVASSEAVTTTFDELNLVAKVTVEQSALDQLSRVEVDADLWARKAVDGSEARFGFELIADQSEARSSLAITLNSEDDSLFEIHLRPGAVGEGLSGEWSVAVEDTNLRPLMLGIELPTFSFEGQGNLEMAATGDNILVRGGVVLETSNLQRWREELGSLGAIRAELDFAVERSSDHYRFTELDLDLQGAAPVMNLVLSQGVEYYPQSREVKVAEPEEAVVALNLSGVPMAWLQSWTEPVIVDGRAATGSWIGKATAQGLRFEQADEFRVEGISWAENGRTIMTGVDFGAQISVEIADAAWQFEVTDASLAHAGQVLAQGSLRGGQADRAAVGVVVDGRYEVDLGLLGERITVLSPFPLQSGKLSGALRVGASERISVASNFELEELMARSGERLPSVKVEGRLDRLPEGRWEAHLPLEIEQSNRLSELTINLQAAPTSIGWEVNGSVTGQSIYWIDVMSLGSPVAQLREAKMNALVPIVGGVLSSVDLSDESLPEWSGISGSIQAAIGRLELPDGLSATNVTGDLVISPEAIHLNEVEVTLGDNGEMNMSGDLVFVAGDTQPYRWEGQLTGSSIEVAPLLRWARPEELEAMDGQVDIAATLTGKAVNLSLLSDQSDWELNLKSDGGTLRALNVEVSNYAQTGSAIAALASFFGQASGNDEMVKYADRIAAASKVAARFSEMNYDQLSFNVRAEAQGDVVIETLSLISPEFRILGSGSISHSVGVPVWLQPLLLTLNISAREAMAEDLTVLKLLGSEQDALGYLPFIQEINLDGSLIQVGTLEIERLLMQALRSP